MIVRFTFHRVCSEHSSFISIAVSKMSLSVGGYNENQSWFEKRTQLRVIQEGGDWTVPSINNLTAGHALNNDSRKAAVCAGCSCETLGTCSVHVLF